MPKSGKFIVIEGGDGCGKSTIMDFLKEKLASRGDVIFTREPGGTEYGEKIRDSLLSTGMEEKISVLAELFSFCASRANHCDLLIRPSLKSGKIIISDRFDASTLAYQIYGYGNEKFSRVFKLINSCAKGEGTAGEINPDLVLFLDVLPETGLKRTDTRGEKNRLDGKKLEFYQKVREGYLVQKRIRKNWIRIDANQPLEKVKFEVWETIKKHIKRK